MTPVCQLSQFWQYQEDQMSTSRTITQIAQTIETAAETAPPGVTALPMGRPYARLHKEIADAMASLKGCGEVPDDAGYVYVVRQGSGDLVKIGRAQDPKRRITDLQVSNGAFLRLVAIVHWGALERRFHGLHYATHVHGEWFRIKGNPFKQTGPVCFGCANHRTFRIGDLATDMKALAQRAEEESRLGDEWIRVLDGPR